MDVNIADMRTVYCGASLVPEKLDSDPMKQFRLWLQDAVDAVDEEEPNAMTLATATRDGQPNARMVLLKGVDSRGFRFFTHYNSQKGCELAENPQASLVFWWRTLSRSVRVYGHVEKISAQESDEYFRSRPLGSQVSAITSSQSQVCYFYGSWLLLLLQLQFTFSRYTLLLMSELIK